MRFNKIFRFQKRRKIMADYSQLNGYMPVSSSSSRVWKVQKKRKTQDRQRQNGKNDKKKKKEEDRQLLVDEVDIQSAKETEDGKETEEYGNSRTVEKKSLKIDVKI